MEVHRCGLCGGPLNPAYPTCEACGGALVSYTSPVGRLLAIVGAFTLAIGIFAGIAFDHSETMTPNGPVAFFDRHGWLFYVIIGFAALAPILMGRFRAHAWVRPI